jgi:hypothetical protein
MVGSPTAEEANGAGQGRRLMSMMPLRKMVAQQLRQIADVAAKQVRGTPHAGGPLFAHATVRALLLAHGLL